jgi:hypothetical protein
MKFSLKNNEYNALENVFPNLRIWHPSNGRNGVLRDRIKINPNNTLTICTLPSKTILPYRRPLT